MNLAFIEDIFLQNTIYSAEFSLKLFSFVNQKNLFSIMDEKLLGQSQAEKSRGEGGDILCKFLMNNLFCKLNK